MDDDDIHVAGELAMLKAIVQKMNGGQTGRGVLPNSVFGHQPGLVTVGSDEDRHAGSAGDEQRFVAKALGVSVWIDSFRGVSGASIASGEHIDGHPFGG